MYYIGFLKNDPRHAVLFKSVETPTKKNYAYFVAVSGPYNSWRAAKYSLEVLKDSDKVKENPVKNRLIKKEVVRATALTKKLIRMFGVIRKHNPGATGRFLQYMKQLEKFVIGSKEYAEVLAKAYKEIETIRGKHAKEA